METIRGAMNQDLLPIVSMSFRKWDGSWQEINVLLDTGSGIGLMLQESKTGSQGIEAHLDREPMSRRSASRRRKLRHPLLRWVEVSLEDSPRQVGAYVCDLPWFPGLVGPALLRNQRITVDVRRNGAVTIEKMPARGLTTRIRSLARKPKRPYKWKLPWRNLAIKDSKTKWKTITVNVDTGDNGELTLPPSYVKEFGLRLPGKTWKNTSEGPREYDCGEAEICWEGERRTVKCVQHEEEKPPLIGTELLCGKRVTIDLDKWVLWPPMVEIAPILE